MAFLNLRNKEKKSEEKAIKPASTKRVPVVPADSVSGKFADVIKRPRITEKASIVSSKGVYVFEVSGKASKRQIHDAIVGLYKVVPVKIAVARIPSKAVVVRGRSGTKIGGKKAYVYLKEGDKIEVV